MKRAISCLLVLALFAVSMTFAPAKAEEETVTVGFEQLEELVIAGNAAHQSYMQEIRKLELGYNELQKQRRLLTDSISALPPGMPDEITSPLRSASSELRNHMRTIQEVMDELRDAQDGVVTQITYPAQMMYIAHYIISLDLEIVSREFELLERELTNSRLKFALGMASSRDVRALETNVDGLKDVVKALEDAIDDNLDTLGRYLGISAAIELEGMPEMDFDRITGRDAEADLAAYLEAVTAPAEKALDDARDDVRKNNNAVNRFARDIAQRDLETAIRDANTDFPKLLDAMLEAYEDFTESKLVTDMQEDHDKVVSQHRQGLISQNMLRGSELRLENTKARYEQQRIQLWLLLLEYEFSLIKF